MKKYSLLTLMLAGTMFATAQETGGGDEEIGDAHVSNYRDWSVGVSFGQFLSFGDLPSFEMGTDNGYEFDYGIGLNVTKYLNSVWGIKGQATYGRLSGELSSGRVTFENPLYFDYNLNAVLNLNGIALTARKKDRRWTTLVSVGVGMTHSRPERHVAGSNDPIRYYEEDTNSFMTEPYIPADIVLKYRISQLVDLDLGVQVKYFLSDQIDAFPSGTSNDLIVYPHIGLAFNFGADDAPSVVYTNPLDDMYFDVQEVKGNYDQLTTDDDDDGVPNYFDKDNSTPEEAQVAGDGTAMDVDQDGIPDHMDEDPFTPKGARVDEQGRAVDSDGDGVPDHIDREPNTPSGELVNFQGTSLGQGSLSDAFIPSVFFAFNSANISAANHQRMAQIARVLKANENASVTLTGYADQRGPEEYNRNLAMRRAEAVKEQLVQVYGVDEARINTQSEGETTPLAEGRYDVNRRVDVSLQGN